jgi:hypothetical protein
MKPEDRRAAYACDITYVTNSELGFDYLRDNLAGVSGVLESCGVCVFMCGWGLGWAITGVQGTGVRQSLEGELEQASLVKSNNIEEKQSLMIGIRTCPCFSSV